MKKKLLLLGIAFSTFTVACKKDKLTSENNAEINSSTKTEHLLSVEKKEQLLSLFASTLSKAVFENQELRAFLKKEALKQFDKNYDVLYYLVKDEKIGSNKTFRDILISHSSNTVIDEIEANLPLLNILLPEISFFGVNPEDMDITDQEIPVAVSKEKVTTLFFNGKEEVQLEKGQVPDFHVFVVNENSRVISPKNNPKTKSMASKSILFKSPNYDGAITNTAQPKTKSMFGFVDVGQKAVTAYSYFNKDDGSIYQKAFQRDFIYYGITPTNTQGALNHNISEYIGFIEVNPRTYFKIADQRSEKLENNDPFVNVYSVSQLKKGFSEEELIDKMWTKGAYDFRFEIIKSTSDRAQIVHIPLKPNELWNFNIKYDRRHPTWFRRSKHTYTIDPNNFTSKQVPLGSRMISFGKWDLSKESMYRSVQISEEDDEGVETTQTSTYESIRVANSKFNGDAKLTIGIGDKMSLTAGIGAEANTSNTIKENKTVVLSKKEKSDELGRINIYFYDPIIKNQNSGMYEIQTYNTGHVKFGILVK